MLVVPKMIKRGGILCACDICLSYRMYTGAFSFRMAHVISPTESTNYIELSATTRRVFMMGKPFTVCFGMGKDKNSETKTLALSNKKQLHSNFKSKNRTH